MKGLSIGLGVGIGTSFLLLALAAPFITRKIKLQKDKREIFQSKSWVATAAADITARMIISLRELEKATNNLIELV
ncbi:hypothetical protein ACP70R_016199 [Stipagrostis hirtigluma subsp. patula]